MIIAIGKKYRSQRIMKGIVRRDAENVVYGMVEKAHKEDYLINRKEIADKLTKDPNYNLAKGTVSELLKEMRLKHLIVLKKIKNQHYYGLPWLTTPYWLASIFSTIIIFFAAIFLRSYYWYPTLQLYYFDKSENVFVNHHYLTFAFVSVIIINNFIFAICWDKFGTWKLKRRKKLFMKMDFLLK